MKEDGAMMLWDNVLVDDFLISEQSNEHEYVA